MNTELAEKTLAWMNAALPGGAAADARGADAGSGAGASVAGALADWADRTLGTCSPRLDALIKRAQHNPQLFLYRLENIASKYLFVLIPISLPFLWLMFIGHRGVAVYDHAVFSLYSLSFMSLLIAGCALLGRLGFAAAVAVLMLGVPPLHMFMQLRENYRLGGIAALWRTVVLLGVAGTAFALFVVFIILMSLR